MDSLSDVLGLETIGFSFMITNCLVACGHIDQGLDDALPEEIQRICHIDSQKRQITTSPWSCLAICVMTCRCEVMNHSKHQNSTPQFWVYHCQQGKQLLDQWWVPWNLDLKTMSKTWRWALFNRILRGLCHWSWVMPSQITTLTRNISITLMPKAFCQVRNLWHKSLCSNFHLSILGLQKWPDIVPVEGRGCLRLEEELCRYWD